MPHPVMYPPVKAKSEGGIERFATPLAGVSHVSAVAPLTVVKPAPEPVAFPAHRAGVELLSCVSSEVFIRGQKLLNVT